MIITLKDGSKKEYAEPMMAYDIARDLSEGLARVACIAEIDGKACDLRTVIEHTDIPAHTYSQRLSRICIRMQNLQSDLRSITDSTMTLICRLSQEKISTRSRLR